jgi:hypothetical protein
MSGSSLIVFITGWPFLWKFQLIAKKKILIRFKAPPVMWTPLSHAWALACIVASTVWISAIGEVSHRVMSPTNPLPFHAV